MKTLKYAILIGLLPLLISCTIAPQAIEYGKDGCHYCSMTIVDKIHAAEIVTKKGKVYKFDAAECMINFLKDFDDSEVALYLTNNYMEPEVLIDATQATFLISENVPSPMGAFLTAFKTKNDAIQIQAEKDGVLYTWEALLTHINQ